jgi:hypothetical protein
MKKFIEEKMSERKMSMDVAIQSSPNGSAATTTGIVTENDPAKNPNKKNHDLNINIKPIMRIPIRCIVYRYS